MSMSRRTLIPLILSMSSSVKVSGVLARSADHSERSKSRYRGWVTSDQATTEAVLGHTDLERRAIIETMTQSPYPEASQATTALVLGILGLVMCAGILSPFAWVMGNREMQAIDAGRRPPENRGTANAAKILGIVGTVLLGLGIIIGILFIVFFSVAAVTTS